MQTSTATKWFDGRQLIGIIPLDAIRDCTRSGSNDEAVNHWVKKLNFDAPELFSYQYLVESGVVPYAEHEKNVPYVFWLMCHSLKENPDFFWLGV